MNIRLIDAHNHLQDARLAASREDVLACLSRLKVRAVVNGTCEADWPEVQRLCSEHENLMPSFGLHPWHVGGRSESWKENLLEHLDRAPFAIGEIGLDRWIDGYDLPAQEEVFAWQMKVAAERNLCVTIHCLRAWGRLHEMLRELPQPERGFLLHSYGGPVEMVRPLADLGAYFSISGHFAHERKGKQRDTFRHVPPERLLVETDAPDMLPPETLVEFPLGDPETGKPVNHPGNIAAVYRFAAELLGESVESLADRVEENFRRLFGSRNGA